MGEEYTAASFSEVLRIEWRGRRLVLSVFGVGGASILRMAGTTFVLNHGKMGHEGWERGRE